MTNAVTHFASRWMWPEVPGDAESGSEEAARVLGPPRCEKGRVSSLMSPELCMKW